jgi:spore maturation protein SpmA/spore maturation protein SpmB
MMNRIFVLVVLASVLLAAWTGRMSELTNDGIIRSASSAVELAIGLVGMMALFIGLMRVAQAGGLLRILARAVRPLMTRLFPEVPGDHPAMQAMILNIGANMLGLANAATPFGIKAIEELDKLNGRKGTATNSMVMFLAINTAGLAILPSGVAALRASLGSEDAFGIWLPTLFASGCATVVGVTAVFLLGRLPVYRRTAPPVAPPESTSESKADTAEPDLPSPDGMAQPPERQSVWRAVVAVLFAAGFAFLLVRYVLYASASAGFFDILQNVSSFWSLPAIVAALVLFGWARGVKVYDELVEGGKEGFQVALRIIPYLVAILVAVGMLRASGGIDLFVLGLSHLTTPIGMPAEALPMALLRPLSGSGAYGVMAEIMTTHGADSFIGYMVSTFQGSTETTFYVLAVYFGAVGVKETRHTLPACLLADTAGILAAVFIVNLMFG